MAQAARGIKHTRIACALITIGMAHLCVHIRTGALVPAVRFSLESSSTGALRRYIGAASDTRPANSAGSRARWARRNNSEPLSAPHTSRTHARRQSRHSHTAEQHERRLRQERLHERLPHEPAGCAGRPSPRRQPRSPQMSTSSSMRLRAESAVKRSAHMIGWDRA